MMAYIAEAGGVFRSLWIELGIDRGGVFRGPRMEFGTQGVHGGGAVVAVVVVELCIGTF
jgi:hypothetical protein